MAADARQALGRRGEDLAAAHYERLGYEVLARNHRTRFGELDLILTDGATIVFCEVKTRCSGGGGPWMALHEGKQRQVRRMAAAWLAQESDRPWAAELRFDAVGIVLAPSGDLVSLDHLEGVF